MEKDNLPEYLKLTFMFLNLRFSVLNLRFRKRILRNKQLQKHRKYVSHCILQETNMDY